MPVSTLTPAEAETPALSKYCDHCHTTVKNLAGHEEYIPFVQAFVFVTLRNGGKLQFCGKHYREVEAGLAAAGAEVDDRRSTDINARSESSA